MLRKDFIAAVAAVALACALSGPVEAQPSEAFYQQLVKIGHIVDVACTAKLYRPLLPANDYDTWWAPGAAAPNPAKAKLYPGVTINLPGYKATPVRLMLVRAELDPGVKGDMTADDKALHDTLCALDGAAAKDGQGHCPAMLYAVHHSHVSEVFAFDTPDTSVSGPILAFARRVTQ